MNIQTVMEKLGLGDVIATPEAIEGGLLHKMYQVSTTTGTYAVKVLNPEIMKRPKALQNTITSEKIGVLLAGDIPVISAMPIQGNQVHEFDGNYYMVFRWVKGSSIYPPAIHETNCTAIGDILGKIHSQNLDLPELPIEQDEIIMFDWDGLLQTAKETVASKTEWFFEYEKAYNEIIKWNQDACAANNALSEKMVISHRDLDPKNVLWDQGRPYLIDWESAGYVNPYQEFLEVINYWADDGKGGIDKRLFSALMLAYSHYMRIDDVLWDDVFAGSYSGMLGWLAYNVKRALGIEASSKEESALGAEQVKGTIKALYEYQNKLLLVKEWLEDGHKTVECKLLLFDLDGTLLRSDKSISIHTLSVLRACRDRGIMIGVSTSRSEQNSLAHLIQLKPDILISSGGALVKWNSEYLYKAEFSKEETNHMINVAREVCGVDCEITIDTLENHYWNYKVDPKKLDQSWGDSIYTDFRDFSYASLKMCVQIFDLSQAEELKRILSDCDCIRFSDGFWYKFTKKSATKERAIMEICTLCKISTQEIIAFGDDFADMGMLQLCGEGIAMGNSIQEVKDIADRVIGSNDEDGIAEYIIRRFDL